MFSRKKKNDEPLPDFSDVHVKLKPILGVKPVVYLSVLYGLIVFAVLFLLLFYPGIRRNGTRAAFTSVPEGCGVWIDGDYRGATPCRVFVERGSREVEIRHAYFESAVSTVEFGGRIFGSLFVPRRTRMRYVLEVADAEGLARWTAGDFAAWGMLRQFSHDKQLPRSLSEAARALASAGERGQARSLLQGAALFVDSPMELKELIRAALAAESGGGLTSALSLQRVMADVAAFAAENPGFPIWAATALPARRNLESDSLSLVAETILENPWFDRAISSYLGGLAEAQAAGAAVGGTGGPAPGSGVERADGVQTAAGHAFHPVPSGSFLSGVPLEDADEVYFPYPARVDGFFLGEAEVTNRQFAAFVQDVPQWASENRDRLAEQDLATDAYLADWDAGGYPAGEGDLPVVNVSYHAAAAYCRWLTAQLPVRLSAWEARLPTEEEWEWAARIGGEQGAANLRGSGGPEPSAAAAENGLGIRHLAGNVWEWCTNWYYPRKNLMSTAASSAEAGFGGAERVVKGGSWANESAEIEPYVRGSQPASWCTPYLGFRVVLARKAE